MVDNDLVSLNDGTATRHSTQGLSTPDVSMFSAKEATRCSWSVLPSVGSDHLHIAIHILGPGRSHPYRRSSRWALHKADWPSYRAHLEAAVLRLMERWGSIPDSSVDVHGLSAALSSIILKAAKAHIPFGSGRARAKPWWNQEVQTAVSY